MYSNRTETTISSYSTATKGNGSNVVQACGYVYQRDPVNNPAVMAVV